MTGSVLQGMALTVPIGGLSFLVMTLGFGDLGQLVMFPMAALTWLACQGVVHFVIGRYCNYKSNQLMGWTSPPRWSSCRSPSPCCWRW